MKIKNIITGSLLILALLGSSGCVKSSMAEFAEKMGNNNAAFGDRIMTPYGSGNFWRVNPQTNQDVKITNPDGTMIEIKSH